MLLLPNVDFAYRSDNYSSGNPSSAPGTTVTTGASNADGTAVALIGTGLTHDCELLEIALHSNSTSATDTSSLIDILIDPAGGTSWQDFIQSIPAGHLLLASSGSFVPRVTPFPVWIPAGASIGARGRNVTGSPRDVIVVCSVRGGSRSKNWWCGQKVDAIGDNRAASGGTGIAPNASANAFGSWTSVGSATGRRYGALALSAQGEASTTMSFAGQHVQVGISSTQIGASFLLVSNSNEAVCGLYPTPLIFKTIAEGAQLQMRVNSSVAAQDTNQFVLHGVA